MKQRLVLAAALMLATFALIHFAQVSRPARTLSNADASPPVGSISNRTPPSSTSMVNVRPEATGAALTNPEALRGFRDWAEQHSTAPMPGDIARGVELAMRRREALRELIETNPREAIDQALPERLRRAMPGEIRWLLEERLDARGDLLVTAITPGEGEAPRGRRAVWTEVHLDDGRQFDAYLYGNRLHQPSRNNIPVHGIALDGRLALSEWPGRELEPIELAEAMRAAVVDPVCTVSQDPVSGTGTETALVVGHDIQFYCGPAHSRGALEKSAWEELLRPPGLGQVANMVNAASSGVGQPVPALASQGNSAWTTGTKRIMAVRVRFSDGMNYTDLTLEDCGKIVEGISDTLEAWSYGRYRISKVGLTGSTVTPTIQLSRKAADYTGDDVNAMWKEVQDKLKAAGLGSGHDILLVLAGNAPFRDPDDKDKTVTWGGMGRVGGGLSFIRMNNPDWTPAERVAGNVSVSVHEIGHNLGLLHASNLWKLEDFGFFGPETGSEYGDRYDRMGSGGQAFNARFKQWLRWLDLESLPMASTPGTYLLREHDLGQNAGMRGLQVMAGKFNPLDTYSLFVEYRLQGPVPATDATYAPYTDTLRAYGAQIRLGNPYSPKTWLLDATPETPNTEPVNPVTEQADTSGNVDSPLLPGRTFSFRRDGLETHITNLGADPDLGMLQVEVQYGPVPGNRPPTGSITSSTPTAAAGQTVLFTASVSDPDDSDFAYHWTIPEFDVSRTRPAVFPNAQTISVAFPSNGTWHVYCRVSDKHGGVALMNKTIWVVNNSPPTMSRITDKAMDEDTTLNGIPFTISDATTPASQLQVSIRSSNIYLFPFNAITMSGTGSARTLNFAPPANRHGTNQVTLTVSDGELTTVQQFKVVVRPTTPGTTILAASTDGWRYRASGGAPTGNWTAHAYRDADWSTGPAPFIHPAPQFVPVGTTVLPTAPNRITCHFRRTFNMPFLLNGTPMVRFQCDDGAVVYVNGVEVHRHNLPAGPIDATTRALVSIEGAAQTAWITIPVPAVRFNLGAANTVAVEVHDAGAGFRGGGDVRFNLEVSTRHAPVVNGLSRQTSVEDQVAGPYPFTASDSESPAGPLYVRATSSNQALVMDDKIQLTHNVITGQRTITCTPQPDAHGSTVITLRVSDGVAETWQGFSLTVTPVNDPPRIPPLPDRTVSFGEAVPLMELRLEDVDDDPATLAVTATSNGILGLNVLEVLPGPTPNTRWLRMVPEPGMAAQTVVTVNVSDGKATVSDSFILRLNLPLSPMLSDVRLIDAGSSWRVRTDPLKSTASGEFEDFAGPDVVENSWDHVMAPTGFNNPGLYQGTSDSPLRITTYYRRKFHSGAPSSFAALKLRLLRDDGAAVYLNGHRVWVSNLPDIINPTTPALSDVDGNAELEWHTTTIGTEFLMPGENVLAVEVHQSVMPTSANRGDLSFDLELTAVPLPASALVTLISNGDVWSYWDGEVAGLDTQQSTWAQPNYPDPHWKQGLARLGHGYGGESTLINSTRASGPGSYPAAVFRKTFDVTDPGAYSALHLFLMRDDGAAVFVNGVRVLSDNVSSMVTPAYGSLKPVPQPDAFLWRHWSIDPRLLIPGKNLIAVSVHRYSGSDSPLLFDLQLTGEVGGIPELFLRQNSNDVELAWSSTFSGWQLEQSDNLTHWAPVEDSPMLDRGWFYVMQPMGTRQWFRLARP